MVPRFLHPFTRPSARDFITVVRGEGATVWDDEGKPYVDALASLWYCNVGHGRQEIVDAVAAQMQTLAAFHTFDRFTNEPADALCTELAAIAPMEGARVFLTSSGSEAVDTTIKLARLAHAVAGRPERRVIISRTPSYHGVTYGGMAATGLASNQQHFEPMVPDVVQTPKDDLEVVHEIFIDRGHEVAAVIAEPVIGAGGVYPPEPGYLAALRQLCNRYGAWLIFDEVVCGFGRLGRWWGGQRFGVCPDMAVFAKGVTSGYVPLGGVIVGPSILDALAEDPEIVLRHGHTYSGHPAACAAALAAIAILREDELLERALYVGRRLEERLREVAHRDKIVEVRGDGAVWAVELAEGLEAGDVRDAMLSHGVIARPLGKSTVAFCPPLVIGDEEIDRCAHALEKALEDA